MEILAHNCINTDKVAKIEIYNGKGGGLFLKVGCQKKLRIRVCPFCGSNRKEMLMRKKTTKLIIEPDYFNSF